MFTVLWMRNKMTHLRSQLRTENGITEFANRLATLNINGPRTAAEITLGPREHERDNRDGVFPTQLQTLRTLDVVAENATRVAAAVFPFHHGNATTLPLEAVRRGQPLRVKPLSRTLISTSGAETAGPVDRTRNLRSGRIVTSVVADGGAPPA